MLHITQAQLGFGDEGALDSWPALEKWNNEYLKQRMGPAQACIKLISCTSLYLPGGMRTADEGLMGLGMPHGPLS